MSNYSSYSSSSCQKKDMLSILDYEYFMTNSLDVVNDWSAVVASLAHSSNFPIQYVRREIGFVTGYQPYRLSNTVRLFAFMDQVERVVRECFAEHSLQVLQYISILSLYEETECHPTFYKEVCRLLKEQSLAVTDPVLMWRITACLSRMPPPDRTIDFKVALGGNFLYYKNILRGLTNRDQQLNALLLQHPTIYERNHPPALLSTLLAQTTDSYIIRSLQGLSFERCCEGLHRRYACAALNILHLEKAKKYIDYAFYENLYIELFDSGMKQQEYFNEILNIDFQFIPIEKRTKGATLERKLLDILIDYMEDKKHFLNKQQYIPLPSTEFLQSPTNWALFMDLLSTVQDKSKEVFQHGDPQMQGIYLQFARLLREIYLSFKEKTWLYPSQTFLHLAIDGTLRDIKAAIKTVLYDMMNGLNDMRPHFKIESRKTVPVSPSQYLSVILAYYRDCKEEGQDINSPEIMPNSLETSILHVRLLRHKPEFNEEQLQYHKQLLKQCQNFKVNINFNWYQVEIYSRDRELEHNVLRQLPADWMKQTTLLVLDQRDKHYYARIMRKSNNFKLVDIVNYLKYHEGFNALIENKNDLNEDQLFIIMEEIHVLLSLNFQDIFALSHDDTINLNYLHICLSLYNCKVKEAPDSEIYHSILTKIMIPYLRTPTSRTAPFKTNYPNFFNKWLYSKHLPTLFSEIFTLILDKRPPQDICSHLCLLQNIVDNEEGIKNLVVSEPMIDTITQFASVVDTTTPYTILVEGAKVVSHLLTTFKPLSDIFSMQIILSHQILSNEEFLLPAVIPPTEHSPHLNTPFLLAYLLAELPHYMQHISPLCTLAILQKNYKKKQQSTELDAFIKHVLVHLPPDTHESIFYKWLCQMKTYTSSIYGSQSIADLFQGPEVNKPIVIENQRYMDSLLSAYRQTPKSTGCRSLANIQFTKVAFLEEIQTKMITQEENKSGRAVLREILLTYAKQEELFFLANRLDMSELIEKGEVLVQLILNEYHKEAQTQLIKKFLREDSALAKAALIALTKLREININADHIRRLIHINNRYPQPQVEVFLLEHIGQERHPSPIKIKQPYLCKNLADGVNALSDNLCETILFTPMHATEFQAIDHNVNQLFQKLLYLPIEVYERVLTPPLPEVKEEEEGDDWETDPEDMRSEEKSEEKKRRRRKQKKEERKDRENQSMVIEGLIQREHEEQCGEDGTDSNSCNDESGDEQFSGKFSYLKCFIEEEEKEVYDMYNEMCRHREWIDVYVSSDYAHLLALTKDNSITEEAKDKLIRIALIMNKLSFEFREAITLKMPTDLYEVLKIYKLQFNFDEKHQQMLKKKDLVEKIRIQYQSRNWCGQNDDEGQDGNELSPSDNEENEGSDQEEEESSQSESERDERGSKRRKSQEEQVEIDLPSLLPTYSEVALKVKGEELNSKQLTKLLEIAVFKLLVLPPSQVKTPQVSSFYLEILKSELGEIFLESILTTLRMEEASITKCIQECNNEQIGLKEISLENAVYNTIYLLSKYLQANPDSQILYKRSSQLLPVATTILAKINEPGQQNMVTVLFLYIRLPTIRKSILKLTFKKEIELTENENVRLIEKIRERQCNYDIWNDMKEKLKVVYKPVSMLKSCIREDGRALFKKLSQNTIKIEKQLKMDTTLENKLHVVKKLMTGQSKAIRHFYQFNRSTLYTIDQESSDRHISLTLHPHKRNLLQSPQLIRLTQLAMYTIKLLMESFYTHIQQRQFTKLIFWLRRVIDISWFYIFIFKRKFTYKWRSPEQVRSFFKSVGYGTYPFNSLYEVCNLVVHFLHLESFNSSSYREILMPYFLDNHQIGRQVPLIFKADPQLPSMNRQRITLTRKCSFDMCFFQLLNSSINVNFHQEDGSDHGGLFRELMMGWKGKGIGEEDYFLGKILGISFRQRVPYGGAIDLAMLVAITQYEPTIDIFKEIDEELYKHLKSIQTTDPTHFYLTMTVPKKINGVTKEYPLIVGGENIDLTQQNKAQFLRLYPREYFWAGKRRELQEVKKGFYNVVNPRNVLIFHPLQLLRQLRGEQIVDTKALKTKVTYDSGYTADTNVIKWLWEILDEVSQDQMNKFIQFVTGSPKTPVFDRHFSISIDRIRDTDRHPVGHTCFNTLDLPEYASKEILKKKLLFAICEGNNSFGIL